MLRVRKELKEKVVGKKLKSNKSCEVGTYACVLNEQIR